MFEPLIGPAGYDEINQARVAGNFGWPMFTGPNEAYHNYDYKAKEMGDLFDINAPKNLSRNNTGLVDLPKANGAFIWYPSTISDKFPMLGSGGRSAMVGPVYYWGEIMFASDVRMPAAYDNGLFIYDWMRNWIKVVKVDWTGNIKEILPFMPSTSWHKPIDIKLGADHSLYVAEMGDTWGDNQDSKISRIIYHRGNRPPVAQLKATPPAGKNPLKITFDAGASYDKDAGDTISYRWRFTDPDGKPLTLPENNNPQMNCIFIKPGTYTAEVTITDQHGAIAQSRLAIPVGNALPQVKLLLPENGDFYDWSQPVAYKVFVDDAEDGKSAAPKFDASRVTVTSSVLKRWQRNATPADMEDVPAGLLLMRKTTCFSCHQVNAKSVGPSYAEVAKKYASRPEMRDLLAKKIITGGVGVWGNEAAMPPHPQHTLAETQQMVNWILYLADAQQQVSAKGLTGNITAPKEILQAKWKKYSNVFAINATYTDKGATGQPALKGEATHILRSRLQRAANFSTSDNVSVVEDFNSGEGRCVQFGNNGYITFEDVNLKGIMS
ncbi:MAG: carbohydrate-binding protein, partial [Sphingobacteriales bacterium]